MKKMKIIESLFWAYIGLIVLFNLITVPTMTHPYFQLSISVAVILFIIWMIEYTHSQRKLVYWSMAIFAGLGLIRPLIELIFSQTFPVFSAQLFPPFTPFFSILGVMIMIPTFLFIIDKTIYKHFSNN